MTQTHRGRSIRSAAPFLLLTVASCAHYRPVPLEAAPEVLAPPVAKLLHGDEARIERPYLKPVALDLAVPLDLNAVSTLAVVANPELRAQRARAGVSAAQLFAARLLPDPTVSLGYDKLIKGPDMLDAFAGSIVADLMAFRTRHVSIAGEKAAAAQVRLDLAWAEWQTAGQARVQAVRIVALERTIALGRQTFATAQSLLDRQQRAAGRGDIGADQLEAARAAALDAADKVRSNETALSAARLELRRLLGLPPTTDLRLGLPVTPRPSLDTARLFNIAQAQRLDLQALRSGYASQEAAVHKAVLDQFPTLSLTINAARDTSDNRTLGPAIDFSLPLWNRNRGGIAVARATRAALKAEYESRLFQTRAEIAAAVDGLRIARRQRDETAAAVPRIAAFAAASERAASRGDLAPATAETARQSLRDRQATLVALDQAIAEQTIALELLTGLPLEDWS